jgi:hypothetical protein
MRGRMAMLGPVTRTAACMSLNSISTFGLFGFTRKVITLVFGTNSRKNCSRFAPRSAAKFVTAVTLPPGRLRRATRPSLTGSLPLTKTIGIVEVQCQKR